MSILKKLAGQTAIYGIPSIVGRLINFLLVFLFTQYFSPEIFAAHTEFYAYAAFFLVLLPHGMETAFFNFLRRDKELTTVFTTAFYSITVAAILFISLAITFKQSIADFMNYGEHPEYVVYFAFILGFDALAMLPFAKLRHQGKAKKFALIRSLGILINIVLTVLFIVFFPQWFGSTVSWYYSPTIGIAYVFIANLISSLLMLLLLVPTSLSSLGKFDKELWRQMMKYSWPLIFVGLAGIVNETFDRAALDKLLVSENVKFEIGVYGAFYKLSIIITIFIQAFRYAAEPFFFERAKNTDAKEVYAQVMNYFVAVCLLIALATIVYLDQIAPFAIRQQAYFNHPDALKIVPILLLANVFLGIIYNLSIWYKVEEKTNLGAAISIGGASLTIVLLIVFVPIYGFLAAAYTTLLVYMAMAIANYLIGRKHYPVPYNLYKLSYLFAIALALYFVDFYFLRADGSAYILAEQNSFWNTVNSGFAYQLIAILKSLIVVSYTLFAYMVVIRSKKT